MSDGFEGFDFVDARLVDDPRLLAQIMYRHIALHGNVFDHVDLLFLVQVVQDLADDRVAVVEQIARGHFRVGHNGADPVGIIAFNTASLQARQAKALLRRSFFVVQWLDLAICIWYGE